MPELTHVPSFTDQPTDDPNLFRVVDREGDWTHYKLKNGQDESYLPAVNHILNLGFPMGQGLVSWIKKMSEEEADKILKSAGERGAKVHEAIRSLILGHSVTLKDTYKNDDGTFSPLTYSEWDFVLSWAKWAETFKPQVLKHEASVYNAKEKFAGTIDFLGTITIPALTPIYIDDKLTKFGEAKTISVLLDWKTSSGIHDNYKLQVGAYASCMKQKPSQEFYTGVIRIGTKHASTYEIKLWSRERTIQHYKQFLNALSTFKFVTGYKYWEPAMEQIPLKVKVDVPQIIKPKSNVAKRTNRKRLVQKKRTGTKRNLEPLRSNIQRAKV